MKLRGSVDKLEDIGDAVRVYLTNVRSLNAAPWRQYGPPISFEVDYKRARLSYPVGTEVVVIIRPK
jgi:hypothetical protein